MSFISSNFTPVGILSSLMLSSIIPFEEFLLRSLSTSLLTKPFFIPGGWHVVKNVY